ncbi:hypothetical protein [Staphylococcus auricularis]
MLLGEDFINIIRSHSKCKWFISHFVHTFLILY